MLQNGNTQGWPQADAAALERDNTAARQTPGLLRQWLVATLLAMLPLVMAVGYAVWELERQSRRQSEEVLRQSQLGQLAVTLRQHTEGIERASRQYRLLQEPRFVDLLEVKLNQSLDALARLENLLPPEQRHHTRTDRVALEAQFNAIGEGAQQLTRPLDDTYQRTRELSEALQAAIRETVAESIDANRRGATALRWRVTLTGALALPLTLLLLALGWRRIKRSFGSLSEAIQQLGRGEWRRPIAVAGPADLVRLGERLEWMRGELASAEAQKQQLTRHITHELKSPLAAIVDANDLLRDEVPGPLADEQRRVLSIQAQQAEQLQNLIMQLLDFNAASHTHKSPQGDVDLAALCRTLYQRYRRIDPAQSPSCDWQGELDSIHGYPAELEMILANLLSNAMVYCDERHHIAVRWGRRDDSWWLSVKDDGPGIPPEDQGRLFRAFEQGSAPRRGALKGSGLGLAIVRECCERIGGKLHLRSDTDQGCVFTLIFPIDSETP